MVYNISRWSAELSKDVVPVSCCTRTDHGTIVDKDACLMGQVDKPGVLNTKVRFCSYF